MVRVTHPDRDAAADGVEAIYRREGARLWQAVRVYAGDGEIANDAVAEAFAQLLRRGSAVREPAAWVWKAAFAIARGELKRSRGLAPQEDRAVLDPEPSVALAAADQLPRMQRTAIVLHYGMDLPLREIAALTGTSKATIGVHLTRGRRRLRQLLEARDDE